MLLLSQRRVLKRCPRHSGDTLGTLFGHSGARGLKGLGDTPWDTPSDTPRFRGHSRGHSSGHSGPKGPRDPCSWSAGNTKKRGDPQVHLLILKTALAKAAFFSAEFDTMENMFEMGGGFENKTHKPWASIGAGTDAALVKAQFSYRRCTPH